MIKSKVILALIVSSCWLHSARAETPAEWIALGTRIHGFFGAFIPLGIRIGLDARERLKAEPRDLTVVYYSGDKAPCPCVVDGIMLATGASPGQGTLQVAPDKAPAGTLGVALIRSKKSGAGLKYTIADDWLGKLLAMNKAHDAAGRYDAVMNAQDLFSVEPVAAENR